MRRQMLLLPTDVPLTLYISETTVEVTTDRPDTLSSRRPWLFSADSFASQSSRTHLRAWSVPGHMNEEEMRDWQMDMEACQTSPSLWATNTEEQVKYPEMSWFDPFGGEARSGSPVKSSVYLELDDSLPVSSSSQRGVSSRGSSPHVPRCTVSLDIARPRAYDMTENLDPGATPRGPRRPDFGRMRGDSRAALLGREGGRDRDRDVELRSDAGDLIGAHLEQRSTDKEYVQSTGQIGVLLSGKPTFESHTS